MDGEPPPQELTRGPDGADLLIARDRANQALVKRALEILPDRAIRELDEEDIAAWVVVGVNDDITIDLMTEACGVRFEDAAGGIETEVVDGVPIPFAGPALLLRLKQGPREKDRADRSFLEELIRARRESGR